MYLLYHDSVYLDSSNCMTADHEEQEFLQSLSCAINVHAIALLAKHHVRQLEERSGAVLVFFPGQKEIQKRLLH